LQSSFGPQADGVAPEATANAGPVAPNAAPPAPAGTAATQATVSTGTLNPPDLLARMLVRAAGVDTQVNGTVADDSQNGTVAATLRPPDSGGTSLPPGMNADRLAALLAEAIGGVPESSNGDGSSFGGGTTSRDDNSNVALGTTPNAPAKSGGATTTDAPAFAVPTASPSSANPTTSQQPTTTPTSGASVDPNAIVEQVVKGMAMRSNADGSSEMRLRLEPEQLGTITLKLTVNGSSVSATAIAQNADVRSALMAHQTQLSRSLSESGLKLTSFTVDLSGGDAGNDRNHDRTSGFGRRYTVHEVAGAGDQSDSTESSSSGPPLLPGSTVALLDYLA
jgi:flagellar hook-length control protein FliK